MADFQSNNGTSDLEPLSVDVETDDGIFLALTAPGLDVDIFATGAEIRQFFDDVDRAKARFEELLAHERAEASRPAGARKGKPASVDDFGPKR